MKIVLANGVFDLFHYGHLAHLEDASNMGDVLVVSVTADEYVNKKGRPIFDQEKRADMVRALKCVDLVIICDGLLDALKIAKPSILVKGSDYQKLEPEHEAYCVSHGIEIRFTKTPKFSTTELIDEIKRRC